jgi:hypothetical protein
MGFRTEDFKDFGGIARSDDEECLSILRRSDAASTPKAAESRREPSHSVL